MQLLEAEAELHFSDVLTIPAIKASSRLNDAQTISSIVDIALAGARELGCDARLILVGQDGFRSLYRNIEGGLVGRTQMPPIPLNQGDSGAAHTIPLTGSSGKQLGYLMAVTEQMHVWEQLEVLAFQVAAAVERVQAVDAMGAAQIQADGLARTLARLQEDIDLTHQISGTSTFRWNYATGKDQWSRNLFLLLGYEPEPDGADYGKFLAGAHPEDRALWLETTNAAVDAGMPFRWEGRYIRPDGSVRHFLVQARPDVGTWYHGTVLDVTEIKENEERLRRLQLEVEQASRLTAIGELAASIAHEINQPLTSIAANASAGLRWFDREIPNLDNMRTSLLAIIADSKRAGDVIRGLQSLEGARRSQHLPLDPLEMIGKVIEAMRPTAALRDIVLRTEFAAAPFVVRCDRIQIEQLIHNLILNAFEAVEPIKDRQRVVSVNVRPNGNVLRIAVEDNGVGIDPIAQQHLFDAFFTTKDTGMGMGLAICRSIVEAHGGSLAAERRHPYGSTFITDLPQASIG